MVVCLYLYASRALAMIRAAQKQNSLTAGQVPQEVGLNMGVAYKSAKDNGCK